MALKNNPQEFVIGPFSQVVTMQGLPESGPIDDGKLQIKANAGIWVRGNTIVHILPFNAPELRHLKHLEITSPAVAMPGLIDAHTHLCFAGSRAADYASRLSGATYQQIASKGAIRLSSVQ